MLLVSICRCRFDNSFAASSTTATKTVGSHLDPRHRPFVRYRRTASTAHVRVASSCGLDQGVAERTRDHYILRLYKSYARSRNVELRTQPPFAQPPRIYSCLYNLLSSFTDRLPTMAAT